MWRLCTIKTNTATDKKSEEKEELDLLEDIIILIEKSVMLLGQTNNKVGYFGCLNILNMSLTPKPEDKSILNTYALLLSTNIKEIFGSKLANKWQIAPDPQKV